MITPTRIQHLRGDEASWAISPHIIASGEFAINLTNGRIKIGDGVSTFAQLPYFSAAIPKTWKAGQQLKNELVWFDTDLYFVRNYLVNGVATPDLDPVNYVRVGGSNRVLGNIVRFEGFVPANKKVVLPAKSEQLLSVHADNYATLSPRQYAASFGATSELNFLDPLLKEGTYYWGFAALPIDLSMVPGGNGSEVTAVYLRNGYLMLSQTNKPDLQGAFVGDLADLKPWKAGAQRAGQLSVSNGKVYFANKDIANSQVAPENNPTNYTQIGSNFELTDGCIFNRHLSDNSVYGSKIRDVAVQVRHLNQDVHDLIDRKVGDIDGYVEGNVLVLVGDNGFISYITLPAQTGSGTFTIPDRSIAGIKLMLRAVTTAELADNAVTTTVLANAAVTTNKIVDKNVTGPKLADEAVGLTHLTQILRDKIEKRPYFALPMEPRRGYVDVTLTNIVYGSVTPIKLFDPGIGEDATTDPFLMRLADKMSLVTPTGYYLSVASLQIISSTITAPTKIGFGLATTFYGSAAQVAEIRNKNSFTVTNGITDTLQSTQIFLGGGYAMFGIHLIGNGSPITMTLRVSLQIRATNAY